MIVMEFIDGGSLNNNYPKLHEMSWKKKFLSLHRIAKGLDQMHKANLVHRDFHTGNILLSGIRNNALYITDLGLCDPANEFTNCKDKVYGVIPYIAPEVLCGKEYTKAADVYSFGIIMSEVFSGFPPFNDVPHDNDLAIKICNGLRPKFQNNIPSLIVELMQNCWDADPLNRPNATDLYKILKAWSDFKSNSELAEQIKKYENMTSSHLDRIVIDTHPSAIYTSRYLKFKDLPKPKNSTEVICGN
jgi:serine/threonine protein kinase